MPSLAERALAETGAAALPGGVAADFSTFEGWSTHLAEELTMLWTLICAFFVFQVCLLHFAI